METYQPVARTGNELDRSATSAGGRETAVLAWQAFWACFWCNCYKITRWVAPNKSEWMRRLAGLHLVRVTRLSTRIVAGESFPEQRLYTHELSAVWVWRLLIPLLILFDILITVS